MSDFTREGVADSMRQKPTPPPNSVEMKAREVCTFTDRGETCILPEWVVKRVEQALLSERRSAIENLYEPVWLDGGNCNRCQNQNCYCPERQIVKGEWHENNLTKAIRSLLEVKG